jgi:hypothetical protein
MPERTETIETKHGGVETEDVQPKQEQAEEDNLQELADNEVGELTKGQQELETNGADRLKKANDSVHLTDDKFSELVKQSGVREKLQAITEKARSLPEKLRKELTRMIAGGMITVAATIAVDVGNRPAAAFENKKTNAEKVVSPDKNQTSEATKIKEKLVQHIGSQEYLNKLKIEFKDDINKAKECQQERIKNLQSVRIDIIPQAELKDYIGDKGLIGFYDPSRHTLVVGDKATRDEKVDVLEHELLHASIGSDKFITEHAKKLLADSYQNHAKYENPTANREKDYFGDSNERLERKQKLDLEMENLGIKKYGEEFTKKHYDELIKLYKNKKLSQDAEEFIGTTKLNFDGFKKIFDQIASKEDRKDISYA